MILSKTEKVLLALLRAGLWMREPEEAELLSLTDDEWNEVYRLANEQTVAGPVFQGICMLEEDAMPPTDLLELWVVQVEHIEQASRHMAEIIDEIITFLHEKSLHPLLLKGHGIARMYEHPLQRSCGDIDLYLHDDEFEKGVAAFKEKGITPKKMPDNAYILKWKNIEVELHNRVFDIYNPCCQKDIRKQTEAEGHDGIYPTPLMNLLILNTHILKHIIGPGVGLRQLSDMARAMYFLDGQYDKDIYLQKCKDWHISKWSDQLHAILVKYLGLPTRYLPTACEDIQPDDYILQKILKGGNFGKHHDDNKDSYHGKWYTIKHSLGNIGHSLRLAPGETIGYLLQLAIGQYNE